MGDQKIIQPNCIWGDGEALVEGGGLMLLWFSGRAISEMLSASQIQFASCWLFGKSKKSYWGKMQTHVSPVSDAQMLPGFTGEPLFALCL